MLPGGKEKHPQVNQRQFRRAKDVYGRWWKTTVDIRNNAPCAPIQPDFYAPWYPDTQYVKWRFDQDTGNYIDILSHEMKEDHRQAMKAWTEKLYMAGSQMQGDSFNPDNPSASVLLAVGPKPHPVELCIAHEYGDPWILGQTDVMPAWAKPYFVRSAFDETAFMREAEGKVKAMMEADRFQEVEEDLDPDAVGGKTISPKSRIAQGKPRVGGRFVKAESL